MRLQRECQARFDATSPCLYVSLINFWSPPIHPHNMKRCVVGIRDPEERSRPTTSRGQPSVWFPSMATMAAVLSEDNRALLRLIRDRRPKSLTALAELTGRRVPNLSRSLRMMEGYGLVKLKRDGHGVEPVALATEFLVVLDDPART